MDLLMGPGANWLDVMQRSPQDRRAEVLRDLYCQQITKLGYKHFEFERICDKKRFLYQLIYCSRAKVGAHLWRQVSKHKPDGQRTFW